MAVERIWLDVPFAEKDEAKAAGARWDPAARRWYAPRPGVATLERWAAGEDIPEGSCRARTARSAAACSSTSCQAAAGSPTFVRASSRRTGTGFAG